MPAKDSAQPSPRRSRKAQQTAKNILDSAEAVLIDEGYHNFSMRQVAARAGITLGNLQYHFPSKERLIAAMLDHCIGRYLEMFAAIRADAGDDPINQFRALIAGIMKDLNSRQTTLFFPELWSLANHDARATELMDNMYDQYRQVLMEVISAINPALSGDEISRLALFMSASMEGHTMFVGHQKPWARDIPALIELATESFLGLIEPPRK